MRLSIITIIAVAALISSLNPVSLGVLLQVLTDSLGSGHGHYHTWRRLLTFLGLHAVFYFTLFTVLLAGLQLLPSQALEVSALFAGVIIICVGVWQTKDYFWYDKKRAKRASKHSRHIQLLAAKPTHLRHALLLGVHTARYQISRILLAVIAAVYIMALTSHSFYWLYALTFAVLSLLVPITLGALLKYGVGLGTIIKWKEHTKPTIQLYSGLVSVILGWLILMLCAGAINL